MIGESNPGSRPARLRLANLTPGYHLPSLRDSTTTAVYQHQRSNSFRDPRTAGWLLLLFVRRMHRLHAIANSANSHRSGESEHHSSSPEGGEGSQNEKRAITPNAETAIPSCFRTGWPWVITHPGLPDGISTRKVPLKGFKVVDYISFPFDGNQDANPLRSKQRRNDRSELADSVSAVGRAHPPHLGISCPLSIFFE